MGCGLILCRLCVYCRHDESGLAGIAMKLLLISPLQCIENCILEACV